MAQHERQIIRARVREFVLPPIIDGLVLGRLSPIGHVAVGKALALLTTIPFEHLSITDDVIGDVLIRSAVLRKVDAETLRCFILKNIKPLMGPEEILHLEVEAEVVIESPLRVGDS